MHITSTYRITVRGKVPESWSSLLQGMSITVELTEENGPVTILEGLLRDQAALSGVLTTLYERHFPVISVARVNEPER
jgi:hypothetical protein